MGYKNKHIYTAINSQKGYSSFSIRPLALEFGYNKRAGEYWNKKLDKYGFFKVKDIVITKTEFLEEKRGGVTSTSGLFGRHKEESYD